MICLSAKKCRYEWSAELLIKMRKITQYCSFNASNNTCSDNGIASFKVGPFPLSRVLVHSKRASSDNCTLAFKDVLINQSQWCKLIIFHIWTIIEYDGIDSGLTTELFQCFAKFTRSNPFICDQPFLNLSLKMMLSFTLQPRLSTRYLTWY